MRRGLLLIAAAALLCAGAPALAQKQTLAVVVKGLDNPFFKAVGRGCDEWNEENAKSDYECVNAGPESSADSAGQIQIVEKLIDSGVAGLAVAPTDPVAMAAAIRAKAPTMPVMTIDTDFERRDRGLRATFLGTDNARVGALMAELLMKYKPEGGTVCLQLGTESNNKINLRAQGFRDAIVGEPTYGKLSDANGWNEIAGCPVHAEDRIDLAATQMKDTLAANPSLDGFVLVGGWAQFAPQLYGQVAATVKDKLDSRSLIVIGGDTLPPQMAALKAGNSHGQIGQRPFEMGKRAPGILVQLIREEEVEDPLYTELSQCTPENADSCLGN